VRRGENHKYLNKGEKDLEIKKKKEERIRE
jgi:hypothetical protein